MTFPVDSALALEPQASHPAVPTDGGAQLYVYQNGHLYVQETGAGSGPSKVWNDLGRGPLVFCDTVATAAQTPTLANVGVTNFVLNDIVVRKVDGEVFQITAVTGGTATVTDTGKKWNSLMPVGGTTNQVLAKRSNTDFDTQWVAQASGGSAPVSNIASMNTAARAYRNGALNLAASTWTKLELDTISFDPGNHFSIANSRYIAPSTGLYQINIDFEIDDASVGTYTQMIIAAVKNGNGPLGGGTSLMQTNQFVAVEQIYSAAISDIAQLNAGDYVEFWVWNSQAQPVPIASAVNYMSVVQVDQALAPTSGGVSAGTAARAYRNAASGAIAATTYTKIALDTITADPGGHVNLTNNRYVCPTTGWYYVSGNVTAAGGASCYAMVYRNGVEYMQEGPTVTPTVTDLIYCNAGDYLELWTYLPAAGSLQVGSSQINWLSVVQVDQALTPTVQPTTAARAYRNTALSMPAGSWTKIPVDTVGADPGGHISLTNGRYVCPVTGYYAVSISVAYTPTVADLVAAACYKNGVAAFKSLIAEAAPTAGVAGASASDIVFCNAGDYLELWGLSSAAAGLSLENTVNFISVVQVDQPIGGAGGNAVTPTTGARAYRNAALTPVSGSWVKLPFDTISRDTGSHIDLPNSRYVVPQSGWYQVNGNIAVNVGTSQTNATAYVGVAQNGTRVSVSGSRGSDNFNTMIAEVSDLIYCTAGDVLELWIFNNGSWPLSIAASSNYLSVVQVDAPTPTATNTAARAWRQAALNTTANQWIKVPVDTISSDPGGHISNGGYTVTAAGQYAVEAVAAPISTAAGQYAISAIYKNGTAVAYGVLTSGAVVGAGMTSTASDIISCVPGDRLEMWCTSNVAVGLSASSAATYLSVVKVDQPQYANNPSVVTALPATPYDGQEIYFVADAANGVKWHLRYNAGSSSTYKWEYLGGSDMQSAVDAAGSTGGSAFVDLTDVGPSIVLPALPSGGDFMIEWAYNYFAAAAGGDSYVGVAINGVVQGSAGQVGAVSGEGGTNQPATALFAQYRKRKFTAVPGGATIKLMYRAGSGIITTFQDRQLVIKPIRVG